MSYRIEWMHNGNWRYDDVSFKSLKQAKQALTTANYKDLQTRIVPIEGIPCGNMREFDKVMKPEVTPSTIVDSYWKTVQVVKTADGKWGITDVSYAVQKCGCKIVGAGNCPAPFTIEHCPLHAAAPQLVEFVKAVLSIATTHGRYTQQIDTTQLAATIGPMARAALRAAGVEI